MDSFKALVADTWNNTYVRGSPSYKIVHKLMKLKVEIKIWAKTTSRKEEEKVSDIFTKIEELDICEVNRTLTSTKKKERNRWK